jgi:hypothetical protein
VLAKSGEVDLLVDGMNAKVTVFFWRHNTPIILKPLLLFIIELPLEPFSKNEKIAGIGIGGVFLGGSPTWKARY